MSDVALSAQPADLTQPVSDDLVPTRTSRRALVTTTAVIASTAVLGNVALWIASAMGQIDRTVFWAPLFAIVMSVVAVVAFGGFYLASARARVAIASAFVLTFLELMIFSLTIDGLGASKAGLAADLVSDFRSVVITVVAFYFGSEAVITAAKLFTAGRTSGTGSLDRDLPSTQATEAGASGT